MYLQRGWHHCPWLTCNEDRCIHCPHCVRQHLSVVPFVSTRLFCCQNVKQRTLSNYWFGTRRLLSYNEEKWERDLTYWLETSFLFTYSFLTSFSLQACDVCIAFVVTERTLLFSFPVVDVEGQHTDTVYCRIKMETMALWQFPLRIKRRAGDVIFWVSWCKMSSGKN